MQKPKKLYVAVALFMVVTSLLAACGDNTATPVPATTAAATKAATTAAATTAAATTAAATTAAATTAAATTAAATTAAATTAAAGSDYVLSPVKQVTPPAASKGGNFSEIIMAELPSDVHPYPSAATNSDTSSEIGHFIWGGSLASFSYVDLKWHLEAAKDLKVSSDFKTFTWTLRSDLKWSDGSAITVDDYQFAYDNASKNDKANPDNDYVGIEDLQRTTSFKTDSATGTIIQTLDKLYPSSLALAYSTLVTPVPKKVWDGKTWYDPTKNPEMSKPTVTSGPYMVASFDPKAALVLKPNPNWYRGKANFDQFTIKPGSAQIVLEAVKTGQVDWAENIPPAQYAQAKADPSLDAQVDWPIVNSSYRYIEYNTKHTPMDDKAFRQAIVFALDKDNLRKVAENGLGTAVASWILPNDPFYNKSLNDYKYSLDTSKKLLADAGYKLDGGKLLGKDGKQISLTVIFPTSSNPRKLIATYLQQQLAQLGIDIKVDGKEFNAYLQQLTKTKDWDISLSAAGGGYPDPDSFRTSITSDSTQNNSGYSNKTVDDLFKQGIVEPDTAKRKVIYDQIQKILNDDVPISFLWTLPSPNAFAKKVTGYLPFSNSTYAWEDETSLPSSLRWYFQS
ncbi:MAG: ABC transporter substrate-binding protein [Chloroflexi bacterium]|uniref:ABC transporter substrate-binding protein n=1 Tax=Candidatus Chlorohelix allophototropha TaxID=3003348 RepID=A0A8T7LTQ4_9CHLR|nr:ABC transporter substrate-binding protein [Chloroflexota bacterium]WJW66150.1 ABC transporter substrate-binding protein [Chloroflexota bacterium L227-S17]